MPRTPLSVSCPLRCVGTIGPVVPILPGSPGPSLPPPITPLTERRQSPSPNGAAFDPTIASTGEGSSVLGSVPISLAMSAEEDGGEGRGVELTEGIANGQVHDTSNEVSGWRECEQR